jgi:hypothetical protein
VSRIVLVSTINRRSVMKKSLLTLATILLTANLAHAGRVVMSFTDSRGGTSSGTPNTSYPQLLDTSRADFIVCNKFKNGRTTVQGIAEFPQAFTECSALGEVTDVVIQLGINDLLYVSGQTSTIVATNIRSIAASAELSGARAWIIMETPGPVAWGGYVFMNAHKWTRDNVNELKRLNAVGPAFGLIDVRDELLVTHWYTSTCSNDSLHPTALACRQLIANTISGRIP